ncbi:MAG: hypothetical protein HKL96_10655 [Phycisphaerales bacterium]|nr:hypothetical protein [Phycisphaerales bacterium]
MIKPISNSVLASVAASGFTAEHSAQTPATCTRWKRPALPDLLSFISPPFARIMAFGMIAPAYLLAFALLLVLVVAGLPSNGFIQSHVFASATPAIAPAQAVTALTSTRMPSAAGLVVSADHRLSGTKTVALVAKLP